jgi:hypothetical protein
MIRISTHGGNKRLMMPGGAGSHGRSRISPFSALITGYGLIVVLVIVTLARTGTIPPPVMGLSFLGPQLAGLAFSLRAATHPRMTNQERRPWRFMAIAFVALAVSGVMLGVAFEQNLDLGPLVVTAVCIRLLFVACVLAALLSLSSKPLEPQARLKLAMDIITVVGGGLMVVWFVALGPYLSRAASEGAADAVVATGPVFPLSDLVLIIGVGTVLLRGVSTTARRSVQLLLAAAILYLLGDTVVSWGTFHTRDWTEQNRAWLVFMQTAAIFTFALAAAERVTQLRVSEENAVPQRPLRPFNGLPWWSVRPSRPQEWRSARWWRCGRTTRWW